MVRSFRGIPLGNRRVNFFSLRRKAWKICNTLEYTPSQNIIVLFSLFHPFPSPAYPRTLSPPSSAEAPSPKPLPFYIRMPAVPAACVAWGSLQTSRGPPSQGTANSWPPRRTGGRWSAAAGSLVSYCRRCSKIWLRRSGMSPSCTRLFFHTWCGKRDRGKRHHPRPLSPLWLWRHLC